MSRDWDGPLSLDPIVEKWGAGGQARHPAAPYDYDPPRLNAPPMPEEEPPPPAPEPDDEPAPIAWHHLIFAMLGVTIVILAVAVGLVAGMVIRHLKHASTAHGPGTVFAWLVVGALVIAGLQVAIRWMNGD